MHLSAPRRTVWGYISVSQYSRCQGIPICYMVRFILHGLHIKPDRFLQTNPRVSANIHRALGGEQSTNMHPLAFTCLSVYTSASHRLLIREPLNEFSWNFILGPFVKICWTIPFFVENGTVNEAWHEHLLTSLNTRVAKFLILLQQKSLENKV